MYTLISAIAKRLDAGGRWSSVDIGNVAMSTLYATYSQIYARLSNSFLSEPVTLDLADIRGEHGGKTATFNEVLASLGNATLPTTSVLRELNTAYARYADAFHAGYKVTPTHPTAHITAELPPADKTWLKLTRDNTDYGLFARHCLVSINGFLHYTDADNTGIYVVDGMKSRTVSGESQIGLLSFREVTPLKCVQIKPEMIYQQTPGEEMRNRVFLDVGEDVSNKTVMLVLGGYLHLLDQRTFYRVGDQQLCINLQSLPLFDRYYESRKYLDLSTLQLETTTRNETQISVEDFLSDAVLSRYLALSQSFLVIAENPDLFVEKDYVHTTRMPGMFVSYTRPIYPMIAGAGKLAEYWYTHEDGQYSLTCQDTFRDQPVSWTTDAKAENSIADSRQTKMPVINSRGYFLKIGTDLAA